jgi:putative endonuclease
MHYTYVLESEKDGKHYTGYTKNLKLRLAQHNAGEVVSTKYRRPMKLIYYEACLSKQDALKRERYFKSYYGRMYLKKRLAGFINSQKG